MTNWFATKKEATEELKRRKKNGIGGTDTIFKYRLTKRKKPFFVGTTLEWLQK